MGGGGGGPDEPQCRVIAAGSWRGGGVDCSIFRDWWRLQWTIGADQHRPPGAVGRRLPRASQSANVSGSTNPTSLNGTEGDLKLYFSAGVSRHLAGATSVEDEYRPEGVTLNRATAHQMSEFAIPTKYSEILRTARRASQSASRFRSGSSRIRLFDVQRTRPVRCS